MRSSDSAGVEQRWRGQVTVVLDIGVAGDVVNWGFKLDGYCWWDWAFEEANGPELSYTPLV
jgi:hypothetical protein